MRAERFSSPNAPGRNGLSSFARAVRLRNLKKENLKKDVGGSSGKSPKSPKKAAPQSRFNDLSMTRC